MNRQRKSNLISTTRLIPVAEPHKASLRVWVWGREGVVGFGTGKYPPEIWEKMLAHRGDPFPLGLLESQSYHQAM